MTSASAAAEEQPIPSAPSDNTVDREINKMFVLCEFPNDRDYCADIAGTIRSFPITQDCRKAIKALIHSLTTQARIEELELMKSYDWFGEDDSGMPIYFNDEMTTYANACLKELEGQL